MNPNIYQNINQQQPPSNSYTINITPSLGVDMNSQQPPPPVIPSNFNALSSPLTQEPPPVIPSNFNALSSPITQQALSPQPVGSLSYTSSPAMVSPGMVSPAMVSRGIGSPALSSPPIGSPALVSPPIGSPALVSPPIGSPALASPGSNYVYQSTAPTSIYNTVPTNQQLPLAQAGLGLGIQMSPLPQQSVIYNMTQQPTQPQTQQTIYSQPNAQPSYNL